jgi:hypothetical protein
MTPAELEILRKSKVQEFIREKMGDIKSGDRLYHKTTIFGEELDSKIWPEDRRCEIIHVHSQSDIENYWHCRNDNGEERIFTQQQLLEVTCLRYPFAIDDRNPERGLWGMIGGGHKRLSYNPAQEVKYCFEWFCNGHLEAVFLDTPYLALLRALEAQIGGEE